MRWYCNFFFVFSPLAVMLLTLHVPWFTSYLVPIHLIFPCNGRILGLSADTDLLAGDCLYF